MQPDVAIIGAGVIGAAIAYELARQTRLQVVVIERGTPGCEASSAAAGTLTVASSQARNGAVFALRRASAELFPELTARLEEETGLCLGYRRTGVLSLALSDAETEGLDDLVRHRRAQGLRAECLDRAAIRAVEPALNPQISSGVLFPDDACIESGELVAALAAAAVRRGVTIRCNTAVRSVCVQGKLLCLQLDHGTLSAPVVVVAAGAWSTPLLATCGLKVPVRPARGEMLEIRPRGWRLCHTVALRAGYLVPRLNGDVLVGSTMAFSGYDKGVTASGVTALRHRVEEAVPQARSAQLLRTWAGLRPCSTIRRPLITRVPGAENLILATGHHRNGILLAPITARLVVEMITGAASSLPLRPFSYRKH